MATAADVRALLRKRYAHPEWALCFEVANGTGAAARRYADAVAMNLFPSRGLALHGFEIKVSKSDFRSEIAKPEKSVDVQQYCDHWWIVAPAEAVDETLLPKTWGWMRVDGARLVVAKQAPELEAKPVTRTFMAALVRRANEVDAAEVDKLVRDKVDAIRQDDEKRFERRLNERARKGDEAVKALQELRERIGSEDHWRMLDNEAVAKAVKLVSTAGVLGTYGGIRELERSTRRAADQIAKALEAVVGKETAEAAE